MFLHSVILYLSAVFKEYGIGIVAGSKFSISTQLSMLFHRVRVPHSKTVGPTA